VEIHDPRRIPWFPSAYWAHVVGEGEVGVEAPHYLEALGKSSSLLKEGTVKLL
jgi:hypothetical protein